MKLLVVFALLGAVAVHAEDQKADDSLLVSTYSAHPYAAYTPSVYTAGYGYNGYSAYAPAVYSSGYGLPYAYNGYTPLVHHLKKRDTSAADQKAEDATLYATTYGAHPYTAAYPYRAGYPYSAPALYGAHHAYPLTYTAGYYNNYHPYLI